MIEPASDQATAEAGADPVAAMRRLIRIREAVETGHVIAGDDAVALVAALARIERGGDATDALGLRCGAGQESPARTLARETRNAWLATAAAATVGRSPWARAQSLAVAVHRFDSVTWPRWRRHAEAPSDATPRQRALFHAARIAEGAGLPLPTSPRALLRLMDH